MMMSKNWGSCSSRITTIVLTGLVGLIAPGCTSLATSNVQQGKNSQSINPPSQTVELKQQQNSSTIDPQNKEIQTSNNNSPNPADRFGLKEGMPYQEARKLPIQQGWQPNLLGEPPDLRDPSVKELFDFGYQEVKSCSGTGLGPCRFEFTNQAGELLVVSAITGGAENIKRVVWRWFIEEKIEENQHPIIFDGLGLLFKDNRIYSLTADGQIAKDCKGEGKLCESELYDLSPSSN